MRLPLLLLALTLGTASAAQTVTTSITPLSGIMGDLTRGVATANSLLPRDTDPHNFNMAPSQIKAIHTATHVYAVGQEMEPWLARISPQLPEGAIVNLGELDAVRPHLLEARLFGDTSTNEAAEAAHAEGVVDPHMWLSPDILGLWAEEITRNLVADMPDQADALNANLAAYQADLAEINAELATLSAAFADQNIRIVATHDAYQYLESSLGLTQVGMFSDIGDNAAGARSISAISHLTGNLCMIMDPLEPFPEGILTDAKRAVIDPLGNDVIGQDHFTLAFFHGITEALKSCL